MSTRADRVRFAQARLPATSPEGCLEQVGGAVGVGVIVDDTVGRRYVSLACLWGSPKKAAPWGKVAPGAWRMGMFAHECLVCMGPADV